MHTNCHISATPVAFGRYDPIVANRASDLNASGAITITCVKGTAPSIALGAGSHAAGATRRMRLGGEPSFLAYELYQPASNAPGAACAYGGARVWGGAGAEVFSASSAPSRHPRSFRVCGAVPGGQNPRVGSYADTVIATVNF